MDRQLLGTLVICALAIAEPPEWRNLALGMDLVELAASKPSSPSDSRIRVLRIDPTLWELEYASSNRTGEALGRTAREWCSKYRLTAAINAGMFGADFRTHLGYLRFRDKVYSSRVTGYQSVAAFHPRNDKSPPFRIFDLDAPGITLERILEDYSSTIQNLRLIKRPGRNVWGRQKKKWSEAALGEDREGRILFIFCRAPFSMHDLNHRLLSSGINLVAAQHLEGGPEAQLYFRAGKVEQERFGSFETFFKEDDLNSVPWPVPSVLGVKPRSIAQPSRK